MTMKRAHSALHIKSVDEDKRTFTGIATTPEVDSYGDIVESKGAVYQSPIALLWQHRHDSPVGYIRPTKITKEGIEVEGEIAQTNNPGTIKDRLDEAWESLKLKLVRGLSIGFSPIEFEPLEKGGYRFTSWRWLELSLVTIPANVDATIQTIRSIDSQVLAASGNTPEPKPALRVRSKITSRNNIMDINEQLKGFAAARKEKADRMTEIMNKSAEDGETLDPELTEEYDTLEAEIESIDKHVKRLK